MSKFELAKIEDKGIIVNYEIMENKEVRYRLSKNDGSGYIRTEAGINTGWQNSHYHKHIIETYIIQKGWMAIATLNNDKLEIKNLKENDVYTLLPNTVHNCYLPEGAEIHTVKHGQSENSDWYESKRLDELTKPLSEKNISNFTN